LKLDFAKLPADTNIRKNRIAYLGGLSNNARDVRT